jgi:hypothetical protein
MATTAMSEVNENFILIEKGLLDARQVPVGLGAGGGCQMLFNHTITSSVFILKKTMEQCT